MTKTSFTLPRRVIQKEGVVVIPINEWEKFKEDLEILKSKKLTIDITKARKETHPLKDYSSKRGIQIDGIFLKPVFF